jgi:mono/diheme cytochrome c family protein
MLVGLLAVSHRAAASPDAVEAGRRLALEACAACHQVAPDASSPGPVYDADQRAYIRAPSFVAVARDPRKDDVFVRAILKAPHYPMKEQALDEGDFASIVAYLASLRAKQVSPKRP